MLGVTGMESVYVKVNAVVCVCVCGYRKVTLVMVGLDNAGKTATVRGIQGGKTNTISYSNDVKYFTNNRSCNHL